MPLFMMNECGRTESKQCHACSGGQCDYIVNGSPRVSMGQATWLRQQLLECTHLRHPGEIVDRRKGEAGLVLGRKSLTSVWDHPQQQQAVSHKYKKKKHESRNGIIMSQTSK